MKFPSLWLLLGVIALAPPAQAQGVVKQLGPFTAGHLLMAPLGAPNGNAMDAGGPTIAGGTPPNPIYPGMAPGGLGIVNSGQGLALYSNYSNIASPAYSELKFGFDGSGNARWTIDKVGGGTPPTCTLSLNSVDYPCVPGLINGMPFVADNATLKTLLTASYSFVYRAGFATAGDGGQMIYKASGNACTNADNGWQVTPTSGGGCWIAQYGSQTDLRLWGPGNTADDTTQLKAASAAVLAGMTTTLKCGSPFTVLDWTMTTPGLTLKGDGDQNCVLTASAAATASDVMIDYLGAGPLWIEGVKFVMPTYSPTTWAQPVIQKAIRAGSTTQEIQNVTLRNLRFVGGQRDIVLNGVTNLSINGIWADRCFNACVIVDVAGGGAGEAFGTSERIDIRDVHCWGGGDYCVSLPAAITNPSVAPRNMYVEMDGDFMGFINGKMCADLTGTSAAMLVANIRCKNGAQGGAEIKSNGLTGIQPDYYRGFDVRVTSEGTWDGGKGLWVLTPNTSPSPDLHSQHRGNVFATWYAPGNWNSGTYYNIGDTVQRGGYTFGALVAGTSGNVGPVPPGGVCAWDVTSVTPADGGVTWVCMQATPAASQNMAAADIAAISDLDLTVVAKQTAYGVMFEPAGSSDNTARRIDLHLTADVNYACITDNDGVAGNTIDKVRLISPSCHAGRSDGALAGNIALDLGHNIWTNLEIDGGVVEHVGVATGSSLRGIALRTLSSGQAIGAVVNGTRLAGGNGAIYIDNSVATIEQSGGRVETTNASGNAPVTFNGASSNAGSFKTRGPVGVRNDASGSTGAAALTNTSMAAISANLEDAPASVIPTTHCYPGEFTPSTTPRASYATDGWSCGVVDVWRVRVPAVGQTPGTATNDSAAAGFVGEYISSEILTASAVALVSATPSDITSISLTAGDWQACGNVVNKPVDGTVVTTDVIGWISTVSASLPTIPNKGAWAHFTSPPATATSAQIALPVGCIRLSLAGTTTVYLSTQASFSISTESAYGFIGARRMR